MRVYLGLDVDDLVALARGEQVTPSEAFIAASTDEEDELAALEAAAEDASAVVVAEVDDPDGPVTLVDVAALHARVDDSDDLAWFATQEIAAVVELLG